MKFRLYWLGPANDQATGAALGEWAIDQGVGSLVWRLFSFAVIHGAWSDGNPNAPRPRGWINFLEYAVLADGVPVDDASYHRNARPL